jgi:hypothetical protein
MTHNTTIETELTFVGTGKLNDGKTIEIHFKTDNLNIEKDYLATPRIIIDPMLNQQSKTYFQINTLDGKPTNPAQINGKYIVMFKKPNSAYVRNETKYQIFEGICENFVTNGKCAFSNEDKQMLIVHYDDIMQLKPVSE